MDVLKNKKSGEYFIFIEDVDEGKALLVTPLSEIKSLELQLFQELEEYDEEYLISNDLIHSHQAHRFHQFIEQAPLTFFIEEIESGISGIDAIINARETLNDEQFTNLIEEIKKAQKEVLRNTKDRGGD